MQDARLGLSLAKGGAAALLTRPPPQASATFLAFVGLSTEQCSRVLRMSALADLMVTFSLLQGHEQQIGRPHRNQPQLHSHAVTHEGFLAGSS